jgi:AcrR family transcriptional regulator
MPKVSEEHKERRREEILEAAQRVFARHGFEGATVRRLEEGTGLSRGAIFSYFANKEELFVAVVARSAGRLGDLWLAHGFRALLDAIVHEDPDWLAVQLEAARRVRTDERFRKMVARLEERAAATRPERLERLRPSVRTDKPVTEIAHFLALVANGLALERVTGDPLPDLDLLAELVESGVGPR